MSEGRGPLPSAKAVTRARPARQWTAGRAIAAFVLGGILAVVFIAGVGLSIARKAATDEAIRSAREVVGVDSRNVAPLIDDAVLRGDPQAIANLDHIVRSRVLSSQVIRVKVWDSRGTIVYSDNPALIGQRFPLGDDEEVALRDRSTDAGLSDLTKPENRGETQYRRLLEVYQGTRTRQGTPILFEAYLRYDKVTDDGNRLLMSFAPALLGGLLALFLIQVPLAVGLTRRVKRSEEERRRLLQQAIESSDQERRRIAADLHDSVVQGLAGTSYSLAAMAEEVDRSGGNALAQRIRTSSSELRQWVRELRTLIVSIVPPRLHDEGLSAALSDLVSPLEARGITARISIDPQLALAPAAEALIFRGAQEAVRNIVNHAEAHSVEIAVTPQPGNRTRLEVRDDGRGFDAADRASKGAAGHVGLRLLAELVEQAGGTLDVQSDPGHGTTLILETSPT